MLNEGLREQAVNAIKKIIISMSELNSLEEKNPGLLEKLEDDTEINKLLEEADMLASEMPL